jgi:hypothetical protein
VVARAAPFHWITELLRKFEPVAVSVNAVPPAGALVGEIDVSTGTGFPTVKATAFEVPPPGAGLTTLTSNDPVAERSEAGTCAVRLLALTYVVVRKAPFHWICEELVNPVPVTLKVNAVPFCGADVGERDPIVGTGLLILPPPADPEPPHPVMATNTPKTAQRTKLRRERFILIVPGIRADSNRYSARR